MHLVSRNVAKLFKSKFTQSSIGNVYGMSTKKNIEVSVAQGTCVGYEDALPNGKPYYSFQGIPYAQPPIGELRFKSPVPMERFPTEKLDCTSERNCSYQKDLLTTKVIGSEDCLFLNVYTPSSKSKSNKLLPVMLWIHGGAFMSGSGNSDYYSPEYLVQEEVVVVTCNYRLGPSGFLCLPEAGIPGNAGMKDQLLVIKWVNANITQFGGDANNVTLFGESAGGVSVHLHMLSEQSKPYIHKAICQSGISTMEWSIQADPVGKTKLLAHVLGCPVESSSQAQILEHLKQQSTAALYSSMLPTLSADERRRGLPIPFKPCIEQDVPGAFLTKSVLELMSNPNAIDVPLMVGYNDSEGIMFLEAVYKYIDKYETDLARMIPRSLNVPLDQADALTLADAIRDLYFQGRRVDRATMNEMNILQTDYNFAIHTVMAVELHVRTLQRTPVYFYRFSYDGDYNFIKKHILAKLGMTSVELPGACHTDEIYYLFNLKMMRGTRNENSKSAQIAKKMCRMWTNFAKYGDPTPESIENDNDKLAVHWKPVDPVPPQSTKPIELDYLEIGDNIEMRLNPDRERMEFWRQQYLKWNGSFLKPKL